MQCQSCDVLRVFLIRNYLKTASERPQSGPVTPSASNEVVQGIAQYVFLLSDPRANRVEPRKYLRPSYIERAGDFSMS